MELWISTNCFSSLTMVYLGIIHNMLQWFCLCDFFEFAFYFYIMCVWNQIPIINIQLQLHFIKFVSGLSTTSNWRNCGRKCSMLNMFFSNRWGRINYFKLFAFILWILHYRLAWYLFAWAKISKLSALQNGILFYYSEYGKLIV